MFEIFDITDRFIGFCWTCGAIAFCSCLVGLIPAVMMLDSLKGFL